jgi:hypothetical protein
MPGKRHSEEQIVENRNPIAPCVRLFTISTYDGQRNGRTLSFRTGAGPRQAMKSGHQGCQTRAVFLSQRDES